MKHGVKTRTLGRTRRGRTALMRGLAVSLIRDGQIKTSLAKAKELRPFAERLVTFGKQGTVAARRQVSSLLGEPADNTVKKLFDDIAPQYADRNGGYTRIIKVGQTNGREEAVIEYVA